MRTIQIVEAQTLFSKLLAAAEAGEEISLTRNGRVVVRLLPGSAPPAPIPGRWRKSEPGYDSMSGSHSELLSPLD